jgi:predicted dehydrogenase
MRFGVISTADIGVDSVIPATVASDHEVAAVASRDRSAAEDVAWAFDIPAACGSYEALLGDNSLDAV